MKTKKVGELLREQRELHRLSIDHISRVTRIKAEYIEMIEANQFEGMPPAVYVKGYVRTLATVYGIELDPILGMLRRDYKESETGALLPLGNQSRRRQPLWGGPLRWPTLLLAALLSTIALYVLAQWLIAQRPPRLTVANFDTMTELPADAVITGIADPQAIVLVNDQPAALRPDGSFSYQLRLEQLGLVTLRIEARDQRGKTTVLERTIRAVPASSP